MVYRIFKFLFHFAVKGYFRSITIQNIENIPSQGPVIFVANHTSAFMDPIVLGLFIRRPLYFLARGEAFRSRWLHSIFNAFHMIPVYRPEITPDEVFKNDEIFRKCFDHLGEGKCLLIFPEGISKTERRLRKIKTGTARIGLGAEARENFELGVKILPVGINYSNPHHFRSDLFLNFGEPIDLASLSESYTMDQFGTVKKLSDQIKSALESKTIVIENEQLDQFISQIELLYRGHLRPSTEDIAEKSVQDFFLSKEIVKAVTYFFHHDRKRLLKVKRMIDGYLGKMKRLKLRDIQLRSIETQPVMTWHPVFLILSLPIFLFGYVNNFLPFMTAAMLSRQMVKREDFRGSLQLAIGMFSFVIIYLVQTAIIILFSNIWIGLLYLLALYPTGLFAVNYLRHFGKIRNRIRFFHRFVKHTDLVSMLSEEREKIIAELEQGKREYLMAFGKNGRQDQ